jgi:nucleoside-diphosphate-sugar epimerase
VSRRVLVTGANGFVGRRLCAELVRRGAQVVAAVRNPASAPAGTEAAPVDSLGAATDWRQALVGADAVIHTAARVHQMDDHAADPLAEFRRVNVAGTQRLAEQAAETGVRRLVFVSSVKVMGGERERPYSESDAPAPADPYGVSKWEAEQALAAVAGRTSLRVAVLRPPLVYGPGVKANMLALVKAVARGLPLPLGAVENRRSFVFVDNLVDAAIACAEHPAAAGRTYFVSDQEDVSTAELLRRLGRHLGRSARLLPVPPAALRLAGRLLGKGAAMDRLLGSLAVDSGALGRELSWRPPFTLDAGLAQMCRWYREG